MSISQLRNIAIIAHVDHGKTTLVDGLLRQSGTFQAHQRVEDRVMDSEDLERERGITILAKNTAIQYKGMKINIVDTPGHADFGGEVERILSMVDGVLLVVDAFEGPMAQTRFVLQKALAAGLKPIVCINKIDRPDARPEAVVDEVLDLFIDLGADDDQLEFPVVYTSGKDGTASTTSDIKGKNLQPLLDLIVEACPPPNVTSDGPLQLLVSNIDYDDYVGRVIIGRISQGCLRQGDRVTLISRDDELKGARVAELYTYEGLDRKRIKEAEAGDIIALTGIADAQLGDTVADPDHPIRLPSIDVDEPTLRMTFRTSDSPFAGQDGTFLTSRHLRERLMKELERNVSLRVEETESPDVFYVSGRGELHLSILIETMRREGYEFAVGQPEVITSKRDGVVYEPMEMLTLDLPEPYVGAVMEVLGERRAELQDMKTGGNGRSQLEFIVPARGLIGFRSEFLTMTKGYGIMHHLFHSYGPWRGDFARRQRGSLIATEPGKATTFALQALEDRGEFFVEPGTQVYAGMVVGEHVRDGDLEVNVCRTKQLTNMRTVIADQTVRLESPRKLSLEDAIEQIAEDELVEVTPKNIRLRKMLLNPSDRERARKLSKHRVT